MTRITICRTERELDRIAGLWQELARSGKHTIFQNFCWNRIAAAVFAEKERPLVVAVETDRGAAIIPAVVVASRHLSLLGEELFDYRDCLWTGDLSALRRAWAELARLNLPFQCKALRDGPAEHWNGFRAEPFTQAFSSRPDKAAKNVRLEEQFGRLLRHGCRAETISATPDLVVAMYRARAALSGADLFRDERRRAMVAAMVEHAPEGARLHRLVHDETTVASVLTFSEGQWERFYGIHYDRRWAKYSPGVSLAWWVREQTLAQGRFLDYMTGEQDYKQRLADTATPLFRVAADAQCLCSFERPRSGDIPIAA